MCPSYLYNFGKPVEIPVFSHVYYSSTLNFRLWRLWDTSTSSQFLRHQAAITKNWSESVSNWRRATHTRCEHRRAIVPCQWALILNHGCSPLWLRQPQVRLGLIQEVFHLEIVDSFIDGFSPWSPIFDFNIYEDMCTWVHVTSSFRLHVRKHLFHTIDLIRTGLPIIGINHIWRFPFLRQLTLDGLTRDDWHYPHSRPAHSSS